jgi:4a-hydroxytetrahydrobiopterin dehydratase
VTRPPRLGDDAVRAWLADHPSWSLEGGHLVRRDELAFDDSVAVLIDLRPTIATLDHHPIATLEYRQFTIELWTHDRGGITELDLSLAEAVDAALAARALSD